MLIITSATNASTSIATHGKDGSAEDINVGVAIRVVGVFSITNASTVFSSLRGDIPTIDVDVSNTENLVYMAVSIVVPITDACAVISGFGIDDTVVDVDYLDAAFTSIGTTDSCTFHTTFGLDVTAMDGDVARKLVSCCSDGSMINGIDSGELAHPVAIRLAINVQVCIRLHV